MKRRTVDAGLERQFTIGLITSKPFLATAAPILDPTLIQSEPFRTVIEWCLGYFRTYGEAPGKNIETLYQAWSEKEGRGEGLDNSIHDFLQHLSDQYERAGDVNAPYLLDQLGEYLNLKSLARLGESVTSHVLEGDGETACAEVQKFSRVALGVGTGLDPLNERAVWDRAFADPEEPLVTFPGDAGVFLNQELVRDGLVGIQGPEKRGKTWWCVELLMRGLRAHKKVAIFEVGDLTEGQIIRRLGVRLSGKPQRQTQVGLIDVPVSIERVEEDGGDGGGLPVHVKYTSKACERVMTRRDCIRACKRFMRGCGLPRGIPYIMVSVHPNSSINVQDIQSILERWQHEREFIPDVIIIDYADILAPENPRVDVRHQVNDTWKALRRLSQERHCLVISPTQANAASYDIRTQSMRNFSEDKRKMAHVTGMLGLNQTEEEKKAGLMRLNWVALREAEFSTYRCLWVAQCLPLGRAFCCATL